MIDYEQLYYDLLYENTKLKKKIEELETELEMVRKKDKENISIRKQVIKEVEGYFKRR